MLAELHAHSSYSSDGTASPQEIVERARQLGLNAVAITDHDELEGSRRAQALSVEGIQVIPGVEITSQEGHILCLGSTDLPDGVVGHFLRPESLRPAAEVVDAIHAAGAIAVAAHPYDRFRDGVGDLIFEIPFDAMEVLNGHTIMNKKNPSRQAEAAGLTRVGGSDAHQLHEVGNIVVEYDGDPLEAIRSDDVRLINPGKLKVLSGFARSGVLQYYFKLKTPKS